MSYLRRYQLFLWLSLVGYTLTSYLVLLRNPFLLERLSVTFANPKIEVWGVRLAEVFKVNHLTIGLCLLVFLFGFWSLAGVYKYSQNNKIDWVFILVCAITVLLSFPALSTDIFDYNNTNRVTFLHHKNPWITPASEFPQDSEIYYGSWIHRASVYPPVSFVIASSVYYLFGYGTIPAMVGFKLLNLVLFGAMLVVMSRSLAANKLKLLYLIGLNPLVLIEFLGNGHNDLVIGLFLLLSYISLQPKKLLTSAVMFALGILAKISIVLYIPLIIWKMWPTEKTKTLLWFITIVCITVGGIALMGKSGYHLLQNIQSQFGVYLNSMPSFLRQATLSLMPASYQEISSQMLKLFTLGLSGSLILYVLVKIKLDLASVLGLAMMIYLWIQAPMLQPWYLVWFLPLVPFMKQPRIIITSLVFCLSSLLLYPAHFVSLFLQPLSMWWQLVLACVMILPPIMTILFYHKWYTFFSDTYRKL